MKNIDLLQLIEITQKLTEFIKSRPSIKVSFLVFLTAFMLFFTISISIISDILSPMNETIRALIFMVMLTSGVYSISAILVNLAEYLYDKKKTEKEQIQLEKTIHQKLSNLGEPERCILKYALQMNGNVWLPADNINVISLYTQGILHPMTKTSVLRGDMYKGCQCFAYRVSEKVREYMNEKSLLDTSDWLSVSEASEMKIYQ